jgi:hypothetical protein
VRPAVNWQLFNCESLACYSFPADCWELQAVLVGDPQQLPATVLSSKAQRHHLAQSLFERLQRVHSHAPDALLPSQSTLSMWMHVHVGLQG